MSSTSQLCRRRRYSFLIGVFISIISLFICIHLFSQQDSSSLASIKYHAHDGHRLMPIIPAAVIRETTITNATTTADFPKVRRPIDQRRFTSPAVESLIEEIKKNIKNKELSWLFENCFPNTLDTTVDFDEKAASEKRPDTYVITGDIDAMWLRDSSAQINPYLPLISSDRKLRQLIEGVLLRQCIFIQRDPYANAHYKDTNRTSEWKRMDRTEMRPGVHERKWELDSLCYVLRLMHSYWKAVEYDLTFFRENEKEFRSTIRIILQTMKEQQRFNGSGIYTYQRQGHPSDPHGHKAKPNGLIHTFFRPSDDLQKFPYLIPSQFFAHHTLKLLLELVKKLEWGNYFNGDILKLISDLHDILFDDKIANNQETIITFKHPTHGLIYSYEIDGFGNRNLMDDSNIPSLLSLPYLSPDDFPLKHSIYQNTRKFVLSSDNPWFFKGNLLEGNGGPHVGNSMAWPLAIIMRGLTTIDNDEIRLCLKMLQKSHGNTGFMHESINVNNQMHYTRSWFAWANSLFGEFIWKLYIEKPHLLN
ncbi:unnamed protein product [Rotaria socialis]|uniref:Glycoside hydrolase family 125 protein n=1 Tax=Rotaria socialis TaxID=392032 RepID=A0A820RV91_9BILA|nr:unnamed protein product [Rotaria socialis]CAF3245377.1 unnamed protein product [Rotaria socialis]CAF3333129.1 unnamed protein product [Rotaria socialis]CAF3553597.1 unnamed protein product [Rotaria socialis]CAF4154124.1 unnamed protein product [Rotaria socialis]